MALNLVESMAVPSALLWVDWLAAMMVDPKAGAKGVTSAVLLVASTVGQKVDVKVDVMVALKAGEMVG